MTTPEQRATIKAVIDEIPHASWCDIRGGKRCSCTNGALVNPALDALNAILAHVEHLEARVKAAEALADACAFEDYSEMRMNKALAAFQATAVRTGDHAPVQWAGPDTAKPSGDVGAVGAGC